MHRFACAWTLAGAKASQMLINSCDDGTNECNDFRRTRGVVPLWNSYRSMKIKLYSFIRIQHMYYIWYKKNYKFLQTSFFPIRPLRRTFRGVKIVSTSQKPNHPRYRKSSAIQNVYLTTKKLSQRETVTKAGSRVRRYLQMNPIAT